MTKKSRLKKLRTKSLKNQKQKKLEKIASEHDGEIVEEKKLDSNVPRKGVITFRVEDVIVGRSIYNIMEDIDAD